MRLLIVLILLCGCQKPKPEPKKVEQPKESTPVEKFTVDTAFMLDKETKFPLVEVRKQVKINGNWHTFIYRKEP